MGKERFSTKAGIFLVPEELDDGWYDVK